MKKTLILILILTLVGCGSHKNKTIETKVTSSQKIENFIKSQNYIVHLPNNWQPILNSHDSLSFSPKNLGDIFYKNMVTIFKKSKDKSEKASLKTFTEKNIGMLNSKNKFNNTVYTTKQTRFGETYIFGYKQHWNATNYIVNIIYFEYKDDNYMLRYDSSDKFYNTYLTDVDFIYNNLEFNN
ncbi:MAG: hypothetical protein COS42_09575 [Flavobacteriales bacterium CG03_land_8_20_14_0_80_35_15]|nr:MAG: hypothetical protein AUJ53_01220 [Flavobacteriaceae bacterium CG1_02_35_72]PIV16528.1 MAG: hypothetical protein COS42_09575 [Flavobacteriales bacterium CG03_land_8_20_14_0_80_35_15]